MFSLRVQISSKIKNEKKGSSHVDVLYVQSKGKYSSNAAAYSSVSSVWG